MRIELKDEKYQDYHVTLDLNKDFALIGNDLLNKNEHSFARHDIHFEEKCLHIEGIYIYFCRKTYLEDRNIKVSSSGPYIQVHFEVDNGTTHYKPNSASEIEILTGPGEYTFFHVPRLDGTLHFPKSDRAISVEIEISEKWLKQFFGPELNLLGEFGKKIISREMAIFMNSSFPITSELSIIIHKLYHTPVVGQIQKIYLESKLLELISLIIQQSASNIKPRNNNFSKYDQAKVQKVHALISDNIRISYSIEQLAEFGGMNRTKLQALFQAIYGKTIHEYVIESRMTLALSLLTKEGKHLKMQEIANRVGYSHYNHFSVVFKKFYGISPGKI
ncbi:helix-turn-helix transcriptional regulator [Sphingobacterium lactis]|uniref:AraC-type DNA-binding protein n=1 Tax=Sphingobacterium lactis TaxID=797291 RepID=A0A1H5YYM0_9SPHI|nr:AraC family transcriptional regulator [Sphingobacterium lactis]SEG28962.1 AraC-type DNA-binding protein [Sphingobacterium lactis]